ncbi:unnamed protein product [Rangifer tarandus platyrhynchus]|uniref:Uncharacterized protein n=1 Tax=Rangifer tarandus platyrhynchus TaxID=3082113 RepID=A0ABN8Z9S8_RANTA|nr:unnamed protein product [Rangifer tarandus platyrhynchus]
MMSDVEHLFMCLLAFLYVFFGEIAFNITEFLKGSLLPHLPAGMHCLRCSKVSHLMAFLLVTGFPFLGWACACVHVRVHVCVCVCIRDRERLRGEAHLKSAVEKHFGAHTCKKTLTSANICFRPILLSCCSIFLK